MEYLCLPHAASQLRISTLADCRFNQVSFAGKTFPRSLPFAHQFALGRAEKLSFDNSRKLRNITRRFGRCVDSWVINSPWSLDAHLLQRLLRDAVGVTVQVDSMARSSRGIRRGVGRVVVHRLLDWAGLLLGSLLQIHSELHELVFVLSILNVEAMEFPFRIKR